MTDRNSQNASVTATVRTPLRVERAPIVRLDGANGRRCCPCAPYPTGKPWLCTFFVFHAATDHPMKLAYAACARLCRHFRRGPLLVRPPAARSVRGRYKLCAGGCRLHT
jgi:hypothetical protein